ncbi:MAG: S41 family peptidase [candidate division Zixibacteria bacterium]
MFDLRRFLLQLTALFVFAMGLLWVSGSGIALQTSSAEEEDIYQQLHNNFAVNSDMIIADTINIDAKEKAPQTHDDDPESPETLYKNIKIFNNMAYHIKNRYMEEVDVKKLIRSGIKGMLADLDPFSVLLEESGYENLMESTHGKYEGLGISIDSRGERIRIITPMEGTPAYRMGLQAGDIIWEIEGKPTLDMDSREAVNMMRGAAGTSVNIKIKREGVSELLEYEIERAVIELKSVNYYGFIEGTNIGYVRLSRFAEETDRELREAFADLANEKPMEGVIFDLRSNGGGLLHQAIETANLFLDSAQLVVFTRGRDIGSERYYNTDKSPVYPEGKVIVLVNGGTASASEIVAGAIQDWDRGIIMGQETYGKGLVQQVFPVGPDRSIALKLTTAKYYIPSGRCIQRLERNHKRGSEAFNEQMDEESDSDSLVTEEGKELFYTNGGREVFGGGGIYPDMVIEPELWYPIEMSLSGQSMFFDFAIKYSAVHPEIDWNFEVTDKILEEFKQFLKEKDFTYKTALEASLEDLKDIISEEDKEDLFKPSIENLEALIEKEKEVDLERSVDYIKRSVKREIFAKLYGQRGLYEGIIHKYDRTVLKALELILDDEKFTNTIRDGSRSKAEL